MQLHSLIVSEPAGVVTGFGVGLTVFYAARLCGFDGHTCLVLGCISHFMTNTIIAGNINVCLLDFLALVLRLPAAAASTLWMNHFVTSGRLF